MNLVAIVVDDDTVDSGSAMLRGVANDEVDEWIVGSMSSLIGVRIKMSTKLLSKLNYRNVMNVEHLLNYPEENNAVMDSPTDEEIIEAVLNDEANDLELDDSITIPQVSSREVFQAIVTIKNYLLQHDQNIPEVVHALHKIKDQMHFGEERNNQLWRHFSKKYDLLMCLKINH
ncbi:hypothetical protein AgCh_027454 [Apium graveolens]